MFRRPSKDEARTRLGKEVEAMLVKDYLEILGNPRRLIWASFIRGLFTGLGGVIGATVIVAILIWILNLFGGFPLVGEWFRSLGEGLRQ